MKNKMLKKAVVWVILVSAAVGTTIVYSHCQIPCGIYNDPVRFEMMAEHITTIHKAMSQINKLSEAQKPNLNQIIRWVENKEKHADELSQIITYYFMAQRLKPIDQAESKAYEEYVRQLTMLHEMLVYSMKAKQTTDLSHPEKLNTLLARFRTIYFALGDHKH